jgi:hypothetical protein
MQGFKTSAPKPAAHDSSTIDFFFFPEPSAPEPANPFYKLRVPLLPDNYHPDRSNHAVESLDEAVPAPEIHIVAAHPEDVVPVALTEVVNNAGLEGDVSEWTKIFSSSSEAKEPGIIMEVLKNMLDDILGRNSLKTAA